MNSRHPLKSGSPAPRSRVRSGDDRRVGALLRRLHPPRVAAPARTSDSMPSRTPSRISDRVGGVDRQQPAVAMARAGDVPTLGTLTAVTLLETPILNLRMRAVKIVDLLQMRNQQAQPYGLTDRDVEIPFATDTRVFLPYNGCPGDLVEVRARTRGRAATGRTTQTGEPR